MTREGGRPPWLARLLAGLIRGPGSEFLRGDLEERWTREAEVGSGSAAGRTLRHLGDVFRSVASWWSPRAVRQRRRDGRDPRYDPGFTWSGGGGGMGDWISELRVTARGLWRKPGFTAVTVLTLGLGIGATTTILSVVDAILLRPLPYEEADRVVAVGVTFPGREWREGVDDLQHLAGVSYLNFRHYQSRMRQLAGLGAVHRTSGLFPDQGNGPEIVAMADVTEDFLSLLSARPLLGRLFTPDEYAGEGAPVVLSHDAWQTRYGGDPEVLGTALPGGGETPSVVVGVLPPDFEAPETFGLAPVEFWRPLDIHHPRYEERGSRSLSLVGRLAPGATVAAAREEAAAISAEIARDFPEGSVYPDGSAFGYGVNDLQRETVGASARTLYIFLGAALLLLCIAGMNAANLLLVRGLDRRDELAVRRALGARTAGLARQLVTESVLLAALGGALGVFLAFGGVEAFLRLAPGIPRMDQVAVDGRILALATLLTLGAGLATGLAPVAGLGSGRLGGRSGSSPLTRLRTGLVTLQLAAALVLTVGGSLLMHSFLRIRSVDPGFNPDGLVAFTLPVKRPDGPDETWMSWDQVMDAVRGTPGVQAVAAGSNLPFESPNFAPRFRFPEDAPEDYRDGAAGYVVSPDFFQVMEIPLLQGRLFDESDGPTGDRVVVVNRALVERDFQGRDPIGATLRVSSAEESLEDVPPARVVGVVDDVVQDRAEEGMLPAVYFPYTQSPWPWSTTVVRSDRDPAALASELRTAVAAISPLVPVQRMGPLRSRIRARQTEPRFQALLIGSFALVALLLASVGLYGSLSHAVGLRTREMGIRMAVGAEPARVFSLVVRQGAWVVGAGLTLGLLGAWGLTGLLDRFLFQVSTLDPLAFGGGSLLLALVALLAVLRPALRASRVDVVETLRTE